MTTANEQKLERWLRRQLTRDAVTRVELRLVTESDGLSRVARWGVDEIELPDFVGTVLEAADEDAEASSAPIETYCLVSMAGEELHERSPRFRMATGIDDDSHRDDVRALATKPGKDVQWGQVLRHNEALFKGSLAGQAQQAQLISRLGDMVENVLGKYEQAFTDRLEMFETLSSVITDAKKAEAEERREERQAKLLEETVAPTVKALLPMVAAKVGLMPKIAPHEGAYMAQLKGALDSLSEAEQAQFLAWIGSLPPAKAAALLDLLSSLGEEPEPAPSSPPTSEAN